MTRGDLMLIAKWAKALSRISNIAGFSVTLIFYITNDPKMIFVGSMFVFSSIISFAVFCWAKRQIFGGKFDEPDPDYSDTDCE